MKQTSSFPRGNCAKDVLFAMMMSVVMLIPRACPAQQPPQVDQDGTIHIPAFLLPESSLLDEKTKAVLKQEPKLRKAFVDDCPTAGAGADHATRAEIRDCQASAFYKTDLYKELRDRFPVVIELREIGGVPTDIISPREGIASENQNRVLINLHGGHFEWGSRIASHQESIPISSVGKIKVVSVDYRMAPEYAFPAASEDVAAVYRELIKSYKPRNIGIYGCSAGGLLTAESIAWFLKQELPLPGAIGMFGSGAAYYQEGDSAQLASARDGFPLEPPQRHPYFKDSDANNPLAFPIYSPTIMAKFPPSLLISSSRDLALSSVARTHSQLVKLGVQADLHVWEGMQHCFPFGLDLPEADEAHEVIVRFFDQHLGK